MREGSSDTSQERSTVLFALCLSVALCWGYYLLLGDVGLYLGDEGYLWYGVQRTLAGAVPLRDFQSYEPGRYYWCALFGWFGGDGILTERAAATAFQNAGLVFAILVASRVVKSRLALAAWGVLVWAWTLQNHRTFEPAIASIATWFAVRLAERPTTGRHLAAGLQAGLAGYIGRNHALYAALGSGLVLLLVLWKQRDPAWPRRVGAWVAGGLGGSLPMLLMFLLVPGFFAAFRWSAAFSAENPNVPYPWPWPWRIDWAALHGWDLASTVALSAAFLLPCIVLPIGLVSAWRTPRESFPARAVTIGAACVGLFYLHHASVRAHLPHLAECLPAPPAHARSRVGPEARGAPQRVGRRVARQHRLRARRPPDALALPPLSRPRAAGRVRRRRRHRARHPPAGPALRGPGRLRAHEPRPGRADPDRAEPPGALSTAAQGLALLVDLLPLARV